MSSNIEESIVLITSKSDLQRKTFGTGFVLDQNLNASYVLTCAHVVRDVGGIENVLVRGMAATLVVSDLVVDDKSRGFDLAVLQVQGLSNVRVLPWSLSAEFGQSFYIAGYYDFEKETRLLRPIEGSLGKQTWIASNDGRDHIKAWDLRIEDEDRLKPGYSGSPVVDRSSGMVLGIVSHEVNKGEKGLAISIEAIQKICPEMPFQIPQINPSYTPEIKLRTQGMEVFVSFSPKDEKLLKELENYLTNINISIWHQGKIIAGKNKRVEIQNHINSAQIVLLLISMNFMNDEQCRAQVQQAIERRNKGLSHVIPVLISPIPNWQSAKLSESQLGEFQYLPKNGNFVSDSSWKNKNNALIKIAEEFTEAVEEIVAELDN